MLSDLASGQKTDASVFADAGTLAGNLGGGTKGGTVAPLHIGVEQLRAQKREIDKAEP